MLSMVCGDLYNERPLEKWKTHAYAEHTHQFLTLMLSMRTSSLRVCSACAPVPDAYAQHTHKGPSIRVTGIATPSRVYLIDTGNEGRARDSRTP
jgi:hypothetical protein